MPKAEDEFGAEKETIPGEAQEAAYWDQFRREEQITIMSMSKDEKKFWNSLFALFEAVGPFIDKYDIIAASETPPTFINEPWRFESKDIRKVWPNYAAMRKEYQEAGQTLVDEYDKRKAGTPGSPPSPDIEFSGLGLVFILTAILITAAITVLSVTGAIINIEKTKQAAISKEEKEKVDKMTKRGADFAARVGTGWPYAVSKWADTFKYGAIAVALIYTLKYLQKGD